MFEHGVAEDVAIGVKAHQDFQRTTKPVLGSNHCLAELIALIVTDVINCIVTHMHGL